jgi:hypothetical protein
VVERGDWPRPDLAEFHLKLMAVQELLERASAVMPALGARAGQVSLGLIVAQGAEPPVIWLVLTVIGLLRS